VKLQLVMTGRDYHTAERLPDELPLAEDATLQDALSAINALLGEAGLPTSCLLALNGEHVGSVASFTDRAIRDGEELVIIAPVAGG
jgi:molybdopterin converting factor small subunit